MKAVVSGSYGFIGSHLCEALLSRKYQVVRIPQELLYSPHDLRVFFETETPDVIFHLAAYGNHSNQDNTAMTIFANVIGTYNMLDASKDCEYKAFINISTSSVLLPYQTYYSGSKAAAEKIAQAFIFEEGLPITTIRPFSIYGAREADFRFIPTIIKCIKENQKLKIDPDVVHDWTYIHDFIDGLLAIINSIDKCVGREISIGTGIQTKNIEVAETLSKISGKPLVYEFNRGLRRYDTDKWVADTKFMQELGWKPNYSLGKGLAEIYEYTTT